MLSREQMREFAERGFVVVPDAVPTELVRAAAETIDALAAAEPPPAGTTGPHFYFRPTEELPALGDLLTGGVLTGGTAFEAAESLTGKGTLEVPWQAQVALNIPPFPHRPGMHHLDGCPALPDGRPGTFTMLAGVLMSDQPADDAGNLWVWPGTHLTHAAYFREHGPDALLAAGGYPPIALPEPEQVHGRTGDLLLAHYLLGHNIGGNTSPATRRAVYYRILRTGHEQRWRDAVRDPWLEYDAI